MQIKIKNFDSGNTEMKMIQAIDVSASILYDNAKA